VSKRNKGRVTYRCPVCGFMGYVSSTVEGNKAFCPACRLRGIITDMRAGELKQPRRKKGPVGRTSVVRGEAAE